MVEGIGSARDLARAAIQAARENHQRMAQGFLDRTLPRGVPAPESTSADQTGEVPLLRNIQAVDAEVKAVDRLAVDMLSGKVGDFHEIAVRLKQSELSMRFALEIRDKLIDAYREVMRMGV